MDDSVEIDFAVVFDTNPSATLIVDSKGNVVALNDAAKRLFAYDNACLLGLKLFHLQAHRSDQKAMTSSVMTLLRDLSSPVETIFQRRDGGQFPGTVKAKPFRQQDGTEIFVLVIENVTSQKMKEGSRIRDKIEADKSNEAKSDFLSSMSHEIRTPIQGTLGALDLLSQTDLCDQQLYYLNLAKNSSSSLLDIVNDVLDMASLDANALRLNATVIDLFQLLDEIYGIYRVCAYEKNSDITLKIDSSVPREINADPVRLRQILCNYISNAIKYSDKSEIDIHIRIDSDNALVFEVNDNGPGVDEDIAHTLFTQHVMGKKIDPQYGSYGIGLSICKKLAALMGGSVGYTPRQPTGASFWLKIHLQASNAASEHATINKLKQAIIYSDEPIKAMLEHQLSEWKIAIRNSGAAFLPCEQVSDCFSIDAELLFVFDSNSFPKAKLLKYINSLIFYFNADENMNRSIIMLVFGLSANEIGGLCSTNVEVVACADAYSLRLLWTCCLDAMEADVLASTLLVAKPSVISARNNPSAKANPLPSGPVTDASLTTEVDQASLILDGRHVLIAEDSDTNLEIFCLQLEGVGATVARARDGLEALEQFEKCNVDIALLDLQMPKLGGFEIVQKIRAMDKYIHSPRSIPIIAMSANVIGNIKQQCLSAGFDDFLSKPVQRDTFLQSVRYWIEAAKENNSPSNIVALNQTGDNLEVKSHGVDQVVVDFRFLESQLLQVRPQAGLRMIELFITEVAGRITLIAEAIEKPDYQTLNNEAHVLKSSSASFGAVALKQLASSLETDSQEENFQQCLDISNSMQAVFKVTRARLRDYMTAYKDKPR